MSTFEYDRTISTEEKQNQSKLGSLEQSLDRKLTQKVLDFVDKI